MATRPPIQPPFEPSGGVTVAGFLFAAVSAGIRKDGRHDVALAAAAGEAVVAGVLTKNIVKAAPIIVAEERLLTGTARAVLVNSGCANACTGSAGLEAARRSTAAVAGALGVHPASVLPASTGVIGALLPADRIEAHAVELVSGLSDHGYEAFARAICTTDRWPKLAHTRLAGGDVTVLGIAKGAGMIHPDLGLPHATMLAFLFTDALVARGDLAEVLFSASDATFNCCTVDGDTSTNDIVLALASGASGRRVDPAELAQAFERVSNELARSMVADGEGAQHLCELRVQGLVDREQARRVARSVATSLLVKTALFGRDANWGRLIAAAGRAGVEFDPGAASIFVGGVQVVAHGVSLGAEAEARAAAMLTKPTYVIELRLGEGSGAAHYLTSDLGHEYVDVNAGYRT
jgi:glutamate N-acetyltransferase/amino-acid N-acetyltransferase